LPSQLRPRPSLGHAIGISRRHGTSGDRGWLDESIIGHYVDYAMLCFDIFGGRVKHWITFNGDFPYVVGHNVLSAHAMTVASYRMKNRENARGYIGIPNNCDWGEPTSRGG
jgi:beta-glucosidase/6-phospho-beta-glucosidase/beta-galactosidase